MEFYVFSVICAAVSLSKLTSQLQVEVTMYWSVHENEFSHDSDILIKTCKNKPLASVNRKFADKIRVEGSGRLRNGKVVNLSYCDCKEGYSCFEFVAATLGSKDNPLESFVSVATNDIPFGSKLFVKEIQGITLPSGKKHNGCVRVDDVCPSCHKNQIDFYVSNWDNYRFLDPQLANFVTIQVKPICNVLKYN